MTRINFIISKDRDKNRKLFVCCDCDKLIYDKKYYDGEYHWHKDCWDKFVDRMDRIDRENCQFKPLLSKPLIKMKEYKTRA